MQSPPHATVVRMLHLEQPHVIARHQLMIQRLTAACSMDGEGGGDPPQELPCDWGWNGDAPRVSTSAVDNHGQEAELVPRLETTVVPSI